jgi:ATP-dependent Clp protease adaptor protein ClpS
MKMSGPGPNKKRDDGGATVIERETKTVPKLQRPKRYKVLLHNDDFTTMEFVVAVLIQIFDKTEGEATTIMLHIHRLGMGVAGVFSYEIAEAKVAETMAAAEDNEYPLLCTLEPDDLEPDGPDA